MSLTGWSSKSILIPYTGARVAFFHQSATEFLAACELARRYQVSPQILNEKLTLTRWDQALFLALSLLPQNESAAFLQAVIDTDFALALNASKYLEIGREEVIAERLSVIPDQIQVGGAGLRPSDRVDGWVCSSDFGGSRDRGNFVLL